MSDVKEISDQPPGPTWKEAVAVQNFSYVLFVRTHKYPSQIEDLIRQMVDGFGSEA